MGHRVGLADTDRLVGTLRGPIAMERDLSAWSAAVDVFLAAARRQPGHLFESTAARILAGLGREAEARAELERLLPRALVGSGPRWLGAIADLASVAAATHDTTAAADLYDAVLRYRGRLVVWGGANTCMGPVGLYLGVLATLLGRPDDAVELLEEAVALEEEIGALPWLVHTLAALGDVRAARPRW